MLLFSLSNLLLLSFVCFFSFSFSLNSFNYFFSSNLSHFLFLSLSFLLLRVMPHACFALWIKDPAATAERINSGKSYFFLSFLFRSSLIHSTRSFSLNTNYNLIIFYVFFRMFNKNKYTFLENKITCLEFFDIERKISRKKRLNNISAVKNYML